MVPLLELANHADPGEANAVVDRLPDGSWVYLNATAAISAGKEVRFEGGVHFPGNLTC